jgi:hypothetical protein
LKGVKYLVDDRGSRTAVVIDLKEYRALWEDFFDRALIESRKNESRESLESVKKRLAKKATIACRR